MEEPENLLTTREAAARLRISRETLLDWRVRGLIRGLRLPSGDYRWRAEDVDGCLQPAEPDGAA